MNDTRPLFSILIPTMNRPELVIDAISSVLLQDCPASTYEVVVSNNGGCLKTKKIVESFQKEYSIQYIQPEQELNMPDHWEWALQQLHGKYVLIVPDRRMLRQGTLSLLSHLIRGSVNNDVEVVTWPHARFSNSGILDHDDDGEGFSTYQSDSIIKKITQERFDNTVLPLGYNTCVKREVLDRVRTRRGRTYSPLNADFSSAYSILCVVENIIRSNTYLTIAQGPQHSIGGKQILGDNSHLNSLKEEDRTLKHIPITVYLNWGGIYEDFLRTMDVFNKKIEWNDINPVDFYTTCWKEILMQRLNNPFSSRVKTLMANFQAALDRETPDRKLLVQMGMKRMVLWPLYAQYFLVKLIGHNAASKLRRAYHKLKGEKIYGSGLEASGFAAPYVYPPHYNQLDCNQRSDVAEV